MRAETFIYPIRLTHIAVLHFKKFNENRGSFRKIKAKRGRPRLPLLATHRAESLIYGGFADASQP
jgi:hypothetical protein